LISVHIVYEDVITVDNHWSSAIITCRASFTCFYHACVNENSAKL